MPGVRAGPPWAMAEMIAAEPRLVGRIAERVTADGSAAALAGALREAAAAGRPVIVTGCGTSEHAAMGAAAILRDAWRAGRAGRLGTGRGAGVRARAGAARRAGSSSGSATRAARPRRSRRSTPRAAGGARTALLTASAGAPARGGRGHRRSATVEMDRSWCHTVGYVSPMAAAVAVGARARRGPRRTPARSRRGSGPASRPRGAAATARPATDDRPGDRRGLAPARRRVGRRTARRPASSCSRSRRRRGVPSAMRDLETFLHGHLPATGASTALVLILTDPASLEARTTRARQALAAAAATGIRAGAILSASAADRDPGRAHARGPDRRPGCAGRRAPRRRACSAPPGRSSS